MKKTTKKLKLEFETLRNLDSKQVELVNGGGCTGFKCPTAGVTECCCENH